MFLARNTLYFLPVFVRRSTLHVYKRRTLDFNSNFTPSLIMSTGLYARTPLAGEGTCKKQLERFDNITKSAQDKREYRGLHLKNGMKVLLVSDPATDKAAAALDVNVGCMSDPDDLPGLAHFCEHMLFLGTEKYPEENAYSKFLAEHGGMSNASTRADHTTYYFDIVPEKLSEALDKFAQFFISPLFTESATERELNAVHSEHEKNISSDSWRLDQLDKSTSNPRHAYNKFGTGNKETLDEIPKKKGINVRNELLKFHDKWYSANIMSLAVLGKDDLDSLENLVTNLFSDVKNKNIEAPFWPDHPFTTDQLGMRGEIVPIKDVRNLNISFPIPDLQPYYKSGPGHYLSHLIGHEGPGSLLSALKARGWSSSLMGGSRSAARGFGFFGVFLDLTEEGINHIDDIVLLVFQYINMLKVDGPQKWIFDEYKDISAMHFRFKDKESPRSYVSNAVSSIQDYPMEDVLSGPYLFQEWKPELITSILNGFTPEAVRVAIVAQKFANDVDQQERWYGTKYRLEKISPSIINCWKNCGLCDELKLPPRNEFLPKDFCLSPRTEVTQFPTIILDNAHTRVWFKQDDEFLLPKANLSFEFVSPLAYLDPLSCNNTHLFVQLFKDSLNEYAYAAELAGLKWDLSNTKYGMVLGIGGYNNKQHVLLEKILQRMREFVVEPNRFNIFRENYIRSLKNFETEQPYQHAVYYLAVILTEHAWTKEELLQSAQRVTLEGLREFIPQLLSKMHVECLMHGNLTKDYALELSELISQCFGEDSGTYPLLSKQLLLNREHKLDKGCQYKFEIPNKFHKSSCTELYYQCGIQDTRSNMLLELLVQIINEPCFNQLRTKEQLGYIVFSGIRRSNGVQGLRIIVQSARHPKYVDHRVEEFLLSMQAHLNSISEEEFNRHKEALAAQRLEKPKRLSGLSAAYWVEIMSQQYNFNRAQIEVAYLKSSVTKDILCEFFQDMIAASAPNRHKLAVYVTSLAEGGAGVVSDEETDNLPNPYAPITDITTFKSCRELFPLLPPFLDVPRKGGKSKL